MSMTPTLTSILSIIMIAALAFSGTNCASTRPPGSESETDTPFMIRQLSMVSDWLRSVYSVLVQKPNSGPKADCQAPRRPGRVYLARHGMEWSRVTSNSPTTWANFTASKLTIKTSSTGGVLVTYFGSHASRVSPGSAFQSRFLVGLSPTFQDSWGAFHLDGEKGAAGINNWPFCYAQMHDLPKNQNSATVQLQTKSTPIHVNGGGLMAAAFPPPAYLSSIRSVCTSGLSNQNTYANLVHTTVVHADKALLIMAANGRITGSGRDGNISITFTVDGVSPTRKNGKNFGYYFASGAATGSSFIPMSLYQLAVVGRGTHTVKIEGVGSPFELSYVTSQVAVIPIANVKFKTVSGDWEYRTQGRVTIPLITARVTVTVNSILVISTAFSAYGLCPSSSTYFQFNVDGKRVYPSSSHSPSHQLGAWYEQYTRSATSEALPTPGSLLAFTRVKKGEHRVELMNYNEGGCRYKLTGAALQVGVVPEVYLDG